MAEPFLGEIRAVGFDYAPVGWEECNGQLLQIAQYEKLYSLLGTTYGGDGRITFRLPDLRGRCLVGAGNGPGLTPRKEGHSGGEQYAQLSVEELPSHSHTINGLEIKLKAYSGDGDTSDPTQAVLAKPKTTEENPRSVYLYKSEGIADVQMSENSIDARYAISSTGRNDGHYNLQPFTALKYIISTQGIYPSRT